MLPLKELWTRADLKKIQLVPGPWEKCRKKTWANRIKRRIMKENETRRDPNKRRRYNRSEEQKEAEESVANISNSNEKKKKTKNRRKSIVKPEAPKMEEKEQVDKISSKCLEQQDHKEEVKNNSTISRKRKGSKKSPSIVSDQKSNKTTELETSNTSNRLEQHDANIKNAGAAQKLSPGELKEEACKLPCKPRRTKKKSRPNGTCNRKSKKLKVTGQRECEGAGDNKKHKAPKTKEVRDDTKSIKKVNSFDKTPERKSSEICNPEQISSTTTLLTSFFTSKEQNKTEKLKKHDKPVKLNNCSIKWWENTTNKNNHVDFHYGVSLLCKDSQQVVGEVSFDRNSNSVWEMELASKSAGLEITFGEDFFVLRINVESPMKRSFEIRFMHWSQMIRTMLNNGYKERVDSFPVSFKKWRFLKRKKIAPVTSMKNLNTGFVHKTLLELLPIQTAVHRATIAKYKSFSRNLKDFLPDTAAIKLIWSYASGPAVLCTRLMCEIRNAVIAAFDEKLGFDILTLGAVLRKFRERALNDLVIENETWVSNGCSSIETFEKILKNEEYKE